MISSYSKGHAMATVHRGVPSGKEIMDLFGGSRGTKKRVFLYRRRGKSSTSYKEKGKKRLLTFETGKQTQAAFKMLTITGRRRYCDCKYGGGGGGGETQ